MFEDNLLVVPGPGEDVGGLRIRLTAWIKQPHQEFRILPGETFRQEKHPEGALILVRVHSQRRLYGLLARIQQSMRGNFVVQVVPTEPTPAPEAPVMPMGARQAQVLMRLVRQMRVYGQGAFFTVSLVNAQLGDKASTTHDRFNRLESLGVIKRNGTQRIGGNEVPRFQLTTLGWSSGVGEYLAGPRNGQSTKT